MSDYTERHRRNEESKAHAVNDGEPWTSGDLEWLATWDGTEEELAELAEFLGRTIEACREQFYLRRRTGRWNVRVTRTVTTTFEIRDEVCPRCWLVHAPGQENCE